MPVYYKWESCSIYKAFCLLSVRCINLYKTLLTRLIGYGPWLCLLYLCFIHVITDNSKKLAEKIAETEDSERRGTYISVGIAVSTFTERDTCVHI
jgi:hypothetical protein